MRLWKRLWCWLAGHDWVQLLYDPQRTAARGHLHTMAGTMGYCARCGFLWDDLPAVTRTREARTREPEPNTGDPYRTPAPLPACKCFVDKRGERRIHPDCPRHDDLSPPSAPRRTLPKKPAPSTSRTFVSRVVIVKNGKVVKDETTGDFAGFKNAMKGFERTMEHFEKTMDSMSETLDRAFERDDKDTN